MEARPRAKPLYAWPAVFSQGSRPGVPVRGAWRAAQATRRRFVGDDGATDDLIGDGQVVLYRERGQAEHVADVVEAVADVVGGKSQGR